MKINNAIDLENIIDSTKNIKCITVTNAFYKNIIKDFQSFQCMIFQPCELQPYHNILTFRGIPLKIGNKFKIEHTPCKYCGSIEYDGYECRYCGQ